MLVSAQQFQFTRDFNERQRPTITRKDEHSPGRRRERKYLRKAEVSQKAAAKERKEEEKDDRPLQ